MNVGEVMYLIREFYGGDYLSNISPDDINVYCARIGRLHHKRDGMEFIKFIMDKTKEDLKTMPEELKKFDFDEPGEE